MAPKRRYKRGRRAVSFKAASEGLRAGERRIAEQKKIEINALKDLQLQQANIDKLQIKGRADKAEFEEGVQRSKFQLNEMSRDLIVENMNIKADRDVDRLRGIAQEYGKKAQHLAQLAPKQAKAYADVIKGVGEFTEALEYQQLIKDYDKNKGVNYQNNEGYIQSGNILKGNLSAHVNSYEQARKKTLELGEPITNENLIKNGYLPDLERQIDHDRTVGRDNVARGEDVKAHLQDNFNAEIAAMRSFIINDLDATLSKVNVEDWYEWGALNYLKRFNISGNSKAGKWVRDKFAAAAQARVTRFTNLDNSKYTAFQVNDLSKKLNNTDDPIRQQIYFNKGVLAVKTGTFHDEKRDKFREGPADLKLAGIEFLKSHVKTNRNRFQSAQDVEDFISPFIIMDSKAVKLFEDQTVPSGVLAPYVGVPLAKRHPDVLDEITEVWVDGQRLDQQKRNARIPSENGKIEADHDKRWSDHVTNKDRGTDAQGQPYEKTDEQFMRDEIELAGNLTIGDDKGKNYIYSKAGNILGFGGNKRVKEADIINRIQSLELDGRHKDALVAFHALTPTKRDLVRPAIESYNKLYDSGWDHNGKKGVVGFVAKADKLLKDVEKGNSNRGNLSNSGTQIKWLMASRVQERATQLINDKKYLGTDKEAIEQAWVEEETEFRKGINLAEPLKYGTGFYARKRQDYTDDLGDATWYIYEATDVSSPNSAAVSYLNQLKKASYDGTLRNAIEARKVRIEGEHQPETVRMLTKYGKVSYEEWLKDPFLISPHKVTELAKVAENLADGKISLFSDAQLRATVPENVKILAHLTGKTDVQVINDLLDQYGHEVRFRGNAQDAARIRADGSLVEKPNIYGQTKFYAARAQGITPLKESIHIWQNIIIPTPNRKFTTAEGTTVTLPDDGFLNVGPKIIDPKAEAFLKSIGVESFLDDKGDLKVTDYAKFFNNNGLSFTDVSWDQIAPTFGLTGIAHTKKLEYQKDILKRKVKSTPNKKR